MTAKEAIEILRDMGGCCLNDDKYIACNMAISALEKQDGKKPTHEASIYKCFTCPTCKNVIDHFEEFVPGKKTRILYKHCHFCGQRILWEE